MDHEERLAWLALKLTQGLGNRSILRLVRQFGSARGVLAATSAALGGVQGVRRAALQNLLERRMAHDPRAEFDDLDRRGIRLLCFGEDGYPKNLMEIPDPPSVLFVRGDLLDRDLVSVAVVGSRAASHGGVAFTERLCTEFAQCGVTVVSGLALGIDSAAHRGALKGGGRTVAVLGCGCDVDYPRVNAGLKDDIGDFGGAVVTEFPLGTPPAAGHFPMRNRIISGLALGVVVVEASHRSGSLITARFALEQGREVFAVPGGAGRRGSEGPHRLLKEGAKLVESAEDVLAEIRPMLNLTGSRPKPKTAAKADPPALNEDENAVWTLLDEEPQHIDEICRRAARPMSEITALLMALELKQIVRQMPGKFFLRAD